jgi:hypothetical protein
MRTRGSCQNSLAETRRLGYIVGSLRLALFQLLLLSPHATKRLDLSLVPFGNILGLVVAHTLNIDCRLWIRYGSRFPDSAVRLFSKIWPGQLSIVRQNVSYFVECRPPIASSTKP